MYRVPCAVLAVTEIRSVTSWTSSLIGRPAMLNCTSSSGASVQPNESGALGFSTERSFTYWVMIPADGAVSAPLPFDCGLRSVRTSPSSAMELLSAEMRDDRIAAPTSSRVAHPQRKRTGRPRIALLRTFRSCSFVISAYLGHNRNQAAPGGLVRVKRE